VAAVHAEYELASRRDQPNEPLPIGRKLDWYGFPDADGAWPGTWHCDIPQ